MDVKVIQDVEMSWKVWIGEIVNQKFVGRM